MTVTAITAAAVLIGGAKLPDGSDPSFETYFTQALSYSTPEPHRAMAMLELLLVPMGTEVRIDLSAAPDSLQPRFAQGIQRGFDLWEAALGDDFPFRVRFDGGGDPSVELRLVDKIDDEYHQMGELFVTRRVSWSKRSHHGELTGTLKISRFSRPGRHLTSDEVTHIVAHELGHAFGLGDCDSVREIMGPVLIGRPFARLTSDEVRRVKATRERIREEYRGASLASR
ncbi:MAG: hypothetical protein M3R13_08315 [Armatimonadota bacterium]|nr:hypothetical protein [Armatimonadota bacterium]